MCLEFEILGRFLGPVQKMDEDAFWETVIRFVEENRWCFGGSLDRESIDGCIYGMPEGTATRVIENKWMRFAASQGWVFEGTFRRIEDGWYIGPDGKREQPV